MDFLKKNYEKVILSIVLLGLAVAAAGLPMRVQGVRQTSMQTVEEALRMPPKPFQGTDLSTNLALVAKVQQAPVVEISGTHNLFNPVVWKKKPDGGLVKVETGSEIGPGALEVTGIEELNLIVTFTGEVGGSAEKPWYRVEVLDEAQNNPRTQGRSATVGQRNDQFTLLEVQGPPDNPTALVLQMNDERQPIVVEAGKPFNRIVGYAADLSYPHTKQTYPRRMADDTVRLEGDPETYKVLAVNPREVTLEAKSNQKRTTIAVSPSVQTQ